MKFQVDRFCDDHIMDHQPIAASNQILKKTHMWKPNGRLSVRKGLDLKGADEDVLAMV